MSATKYVGKMYTAERVCSMLNFDNESINPDVQQIIKILLEYQIRLCNLHL